MSASPRTSVFLKRGAGLGALVGAVGMVIYAMALNEQTQFGSSILWSPLYAAMGAAGGSVAGIVLGLLALAVIPAKVS